MVALWLSLTPLRANLAAHRGDVALSSGDGTNAVLHFQHAVDLEPDFGPYRTRIGQTYNLGKLPDRAIAAFVAAFRVDKAEIAAGRTAARLAESAGRLPAGRPAVRRGARARPEQLLHDPRLGDLPAPARQRAQAAQARLERAVVDLPADSGLWATLGDARRVLGDTAGARTAYERALQLRPDEPTATAGLKSLSG